MSSRQRWQSPWCPRVISSRYHSSLRTWDCLEQLARKRKKKVNFRVDNGFQWCSVGHDISDYYFFRGEVDACLHSLSLCRPLCDFKLGNAHSCYFTARYPASHGRSYDHNDIYGHGLRWRNDCLSKCYNLLYGSNWCDDDENRYRKRSNRCAP